MNPSLKYPLRLYWSLHPATIMILKLLIVTFCSVYTIHCHGYMENPPARNSMWRYGFPNPKNYGDNELFCGGNFIVSYNPISFTQSIRPQPSNKLDGMAIRVVNPVNLRKKEPCKEPKKSLYPYLVFVWIIGIKMMRKGFPRNSLRTFHNSHVKFIFCVFRSYGDEKERRKVWSLWRSI